jgi:hypothetical protein
MDYIHMAQDRKHGNEPSGSVKCGFLSSCATGGFSRITNLRELIFSYDIKMLFSSKYGFIW